jgi:peptidoglycan-N-acetylglucosamine deacetylase
VRGTIAFVVAAGLVYGGWRAIVHQSNIAPAIVAPETNVHLEFSGTPVARLYRVTHDLSTGDRSKRPRLIALTFDDGPYPVFTPMLLDVLHDLHVPATFFLIGQDAQQWPEITRRIESDGNEIGDHTYTHPNLDQETGDEVRKEIVDGGDALWTLTHDPAARTLMRPPHGRYTERTLQTAQRLGYSVVLWTDDSGDWRTVTVAQLQHHLLAYATAPEIVLLHSGKLATIEALPYVVERFKRAGYRFVTVGAMLRLVRIGDINHPLRRSV